jgi:hypothetical protein
MNAKETTMRPFRWMGAAALAVAMTMTMGGMARAEDAPAADEPVTPVPLGTSWTLEGTGSYHFVEHPYFGDGDRRDGWGEGFTRGRLNHGTPQGVWFSVGGVAMGTRGKDYFGVKDVGDGRIDQLAVGFSKIGDTGLSAVIGRQDIVVGDGFLIGDGFYDTKAALWNIPLNFYDGVRVDWKGPQAHALALGVNYSRSYLNGDKSVPGFIYGGEVGWDPEEEANLAVGFFTRHITEFDDLDDTHALSLRGSYGIEGLTASGEFVLESGQFLGIDLAGRGGHAALAWAGEGAYKPTAGLEYFYFSGDDPDTDDKIEFYVPWQYRWSDWSHYYVGDLLASTVGTNTNRAIWMLQLGATPREGTGVRLFAHRFDMARETSLYGPFYPSEDKAKSFAYEYDLVVDQSFGDHWSAWVMGAYATPLDVAKVWYGTANSGQLFASVSFKFGGPLGSHD